MDRLIRNLDPTAYRRLKARAAAEGRTIGEVLNEAIEAYLGRPARAKRGRSIADLPHWDFGPGSERWSEEIDEVLYGDSK